MNIMIDMLLKKKKRKERKENFTNCFGYDDMQKAFFATIDAITTNH